MGKNITRWNPDNGISEVFGTPFYVGQSLPSGSISTSSLGYSATCPYGQLRVLNTDGKGLTSNPAMLLVPLFPSATIPRRFELDIAFQITGTSYPNFYFVVGTENPTTNNFHGWGIGIYNPLDIATFNSSTLSFTNTLDYQGTWTSNVSPNTVWARFEQKSMPFTGSGDVNWRLELAQNNSFAGGTFENPYHVAFTGSYTSAGWNGATLNKIYLGFYSVNLQTYGVDISMLNVRKHPLDCD
jgi:hypothetical protein